ncbi:uncharacterized protein LOC114746882 [Neltuma alba]|uniref:uncharacterized protein LOC114746882 n=1 Tax=Neltuma alba TaxID=207710 RepID=UPI0010A3D546|nr:uncharacterized protein LOC114746882 [Prosopis alba]
MIFVSESNGGRALNLQGLPPSSESFCREGPVTISFLSSQLSRQLVQLPSSTLPILYASSNLNDVVLTNLINGPGEASNSKAATFWHLPLSPIKSFNQALRLNFGIHRGEELGSVYNLAPFHLEKILENAALTLNSLLL